MKPLRRLPFNSPDGKPAYLQSDGDGYLSRLADQIEAEQLRTAQAALRLSHALLDSNEKVEPDEYRAIVILLCECLTDALRAAEHGR